MMLPDLHNTHHIFVSSILVGCFFRLILSVKIVQFTCSPVIATVLCAIFMLFKWKCLTNSSSNINLNSISNDDKKWRKEKKRKETTTTNATISTLAVAVIINKTMLKHCSLHSAPYTYCVVCYDMYMSISCTVILECYYICILILCKCQCRHRCHAHSYW